MYQDKFDSTPAEPCERLFIGGLSWNAGDEDVKEAFAAYGNVVSAKVVRYQDTGRSKGFGFVEYETVAEAETAKKELDGKEVLGRAIKIDFARPRKEVSDRA